MLSALEPLPLTVEINRATPYLPPSYIGLLGASPNLTSPDGGLFAQSDPTTQHVYMAIHTSTGYSPLHQAVNHGGPQVLEISAVLWHFGLIAGQSPTSGGTLYGHPPGPLGSSGLGHGQSPHPRYSRFLPGTVLASLPRFLLE